MARKYITSLRNTVIQTRRYAAAVSPTRFDERREATHAELLRAGTDLFLTRGFDAVSMREITRAAQVTTGAFVYHFGTKERFFLAVLRERDRTRRQTDWFLAGADPKHTTLRSAVLDALARLRVAAEPEPWVTSVVEFGLTVRGKPEFAEALAGLFDQWVGELQEFVEALQRRGMTRTDIQPRQMAEDLFAVTEGFRYTQMTYGADATRLPDLIVRLLQP